MNNILLDYNINYALVENFTKEQMIKYKSIPIADEELCVVVVTSKKIEDLDYFINVLKKPIKCIVIDEIFIQAELQYLEFKKDLYLLGTKALQNTHNDSANSHIINFVDCLLTFSIDNNASDIHFEALDKSLVIRIRIDGELNQLFRFDISLFTLLSSIIKYLGFQNIL